MLFLPSQQYKSITIKERLGESMGLTFQQVQKYEKGVNRIGASRLFQISKISDVPVQFFFEEAPL